MRANVSAVLMLIPVMVLAAMTARAEPVLAARVNGVGIPEERLDRAFEESLRLRRINMGEIRHPARLKRMKREVLDNLIEQELFWQQAGKAGLLATPEAVAHAYEAAREQFKSAESFERRLRADGLTDESYRELLKRQLSARQYVERVVAKVPAVTDAEVHQFYVDNPDKFTQPELVRARQILMRLAEGADATERAEKRARMEQILEQARAGADFAELAREHSEAPTKQWGGQLDPIQRGQSEPAREKVLFALTPGQISDVLSVPGSLEILELESHTKAQTVSESQAREAIRDYLRERRAQRAVQSEIERLRAAGKIEILLSL